MLQPEPIDAQLSQLADGLHAYLQRPCRERQTTIETLMASYLIASGSATAWSIHAAIREDPERFAGEDSCDWGGAHHWRQDKR